MKNFYVLLHDSNKNDVYRYNIMPYLIEVYKNCQKSNRWWMFDNLNRCPRTTEEFILFVDIVCKYQFWSRCQYEWLMLGWPPGKTDTLEDCRKLIDSSIKIDAYDQIEMNLNIIADIFKENVELL